MRLDWVAPPAREVRKPGPRAAKVACGDDHVMGTIQFLRAPAPSLADSLLALPDTARIDPALRLYRQQRGDSGHDASPAQEPGDLP
jgi:hypothetical protein